MVLYGIIWYIYMVLSSNCSNNIHYYVTFALDKLGEMCKRKGPSPIDFVLLTDFVR